MFSSNINNGDYESIFHNNNPNSKQDQEDPHSTFFPFPSPFLQDEEFFLLQHHDLLRVPDNNIVEEAQIVANMTDSVKDSNKNNINNNIVPTSDICNNKNKKKMMMIQTPTSSEQIPRKSSKRDRHSKINTARGPRDRRMRLSLEVARTFFNLQDMLGFDKASRTVDWLLRKSEAAIKEIARGLGLAHINHHRSCSTASSTSDCGVVSGIDEVFPINKEKTSSFVTKEKKIRQSRKAAFNPLARESREKARARARERTREKLWSRSQKLDESKLSDQDHSNQLSSWSSFEAGEESGGTTQNMNISKDAVGEAEDQPISTQKRSTEEMVEDSLVIMGEWSPSSMYNYLHNSGIPQEHQFGELSILWQTMGAGLQQS